MPPVPFAGYEWHIARRFLLARRSEGGISLMSLISILGITIAVFALVATLAVRSGYRTNFVTTIIGANAHATLHPHVTVDDRGNRVRAIHPDAQLIAELADLPGVIRAVPQVRAQVIGTSGIANAGVDLYGMPIAAMTALPIIGGTSEGRDSSHATIGSLDSLKDGIAVGEGLARTLGVGLGETIRLVSPTGVQTPFGAAPRINAYEVTFIFSAGRYDIDNTRAYLPLAEAQKFLGHKSTINEIAITLDDPESVDALAPTLQERAGNAYFTWTWKDSSGAFLQALQMEDNLMFILMSILVLVATSNIISGLIMLIKNKSATIGILRAIGLTRGSIIRIFFLVGAIIGITGTILGLLAGCLFAIYIDPIFDAVNWLAEGEVWDPEVRLLASLPAEIRTADILAASGLALALTFVASVIPALRAARMPPGLAIRYE
ncbi:MAG: ABC transporter permease [Rhodobacteraceae bacterium]|nr:ABC transporter permease [Paracoccaceae bacterium]